MPDSAPPAAPWRPNSEQRIVFWIGCCMVVDASMSLMSIQALWYLLGGTPSALGLYGFAFGAYDLAQLLMMPLVGCCADACSLKWIFLATVSINIVGNVVYGLAFAGESKAYIIVGRLIAGAGSANLALCQHFITQATTGSERTPAINMLRITQTLARMIGPNVGYVFLFLSTPSFTGPISERLFNFYSAPGWVAAAVSATSLFAIVCGFDSKKLIARSQGATVSLQPNAPLASPSTSSNPGAQQQQPSGEPSDVAIVDATLRMCVAANFAVAIVPWSVLSQLTAIAMGEYHLVAYQADLWKVFVAMGAGSVLGAFLLKRLGKKEWPDLQTAAFGNLLAAASLLVIASSSAGAASAPPAWRYYTGTGVMCMGMQLYAGLSTAFSKALSARSVLRGPGDEGRLNGIFTGAGSAGRFAGPWIGAALMRLSSRSGEPLCDPRSFVSGDPCCVTPDRYYVSGCYVTNATTVPYVAAALLLCTSIAVLLHGKRSNEVIKRLVA